MKAKCIVIGGGGHAKVVIEALRSQGRYLPVAVTEKRSSSGSVLGVPVIGGDEILVDLKRKGVSRFIVGVGGVPDNRPRTRLFAYGIEVGLKAVTVVHPSSIIAKSSPCGDGTVVLALAVVGPDAQIGRNCIVNTASIVEHDCRLSDHVHLCPGAQLSGGAEIGEGAFIGAGAVVKEGIRIGAWAVVGAGAVVLRDVSEGDRVGGVPARSLDNR
jgi:UDP-perosamine 4-acetyltransferase